MTQPDDIVTLRNEALRKIGRNVVNFQKIEACLKFLITISNVQGTSKDLTARHTKKAASIRKKSMGDLAGKFHKNLYRDGIKSEKPEDLVDIWISSSIKVEADAKTIKEQKRALSNLVTERNSLIHKDLAGFDHNSAESCRHLISILDPQNKRILQQLDELKWLIDAFKEHVGDLRSWVDSDEFFHEIQRNEKDA